MENMEYRLSINKNTDERIVFLPGWQTQIKNYSSLLNELEHYGSVLALDLYDNDSKESHTIVDYLEYVTKKIEELDFKPTLVIGYSFGGKIASILQEKYQFKTLLIAPSSFRPSIIKRANIKRKVIVYKVLKKLNKWKIIKKIPEKYLGSKDYKTSSDYIRSSLLNVKDVYVSKKAIKNIVSETNIVGFYSDSSVEWKNLKRWTKKYQNSQFYELRGDHYSLFCDYTLIIAIVKRIVKK